MQSDFAIKILTTPIKVFRVFGGELYLFVIPARALKSSGGFA